MPLSDSEIERYARHLVLQEVGGPGQNKLKASSVLVVGAGGLGAPLLMYLAAAGVAAGAAAAAASPQMPTEIGLTSPSIFASASTWMIFASFGQ